ncbi:uncharacterized protein LOC119106144 [Pollicipes pollicipes]|uniref:uncharacterized protein LOC119106144 n=1 Tax=Pollicipes pollicipes TaxID=41117 RepID=UPI001884A374|nr:uncharacterized protein LOC119106144 [Pollicipes pollicipes]
MIKRYLRDNNHSTELSEFIQGFYEYTWFKRKGRTDANIYGALPLSLQSEICLSVNRCALSTSPMFQNLDEGFLRAIALRIQRQFFLPGQIVIKRGTVCRSMFYIVQGELEVLGGRDNATAVAVLRAGKLFGEVNLVLSFARTATIRAATHCDLLVLNQHDVTPLLQHYPEVRTAMCMHVKGLFETGTDEPNAWSSTTGMTGPDTSRMNAEKSQSFAIGFRPTLSTMEEGDTSSLEQKDGAPFLAVPKPEENQERGGLTEQTSTYTSRFPLISNSAGAGGTLPNASHENTSSKPTVGEGAGSSLSLPVASSHPKLQDVQLKPSSRMVQIRKLSAQFLPSIRKVSSTHLTPQESAQQIAAMPAFEQPDDVFAGSDDSHFRWRRFSWAEGESIYEQVRRPTIRALPSGASQLELGNGVAWLQQDNLPHGRPLGWLWKVFRSPSIRGDGQLDRIWKTFVCLVVFVQWHIYLYYACFKDGYSPEMLGLTYLMDSVHVLDILFSMMTIVISPQDSYQTFGEIFHYHARRATFYLDLLAALPLDLISIPFGMFLSSVRMGRLIAVCKLNKLAKAWIIPRRFRFLQDQLQESLTVIRPIELITYLIMGVHFSACMWFMDSNIKYVFFAIPNSEMWLHQFEKVKAIESGWRAGSSPKYDPYILSLYWATATMSTTGFGDIVAMTTTEYYISIIVMVFGLVLFAYSLASYASLLTNRDRPKVQFQSIVFAMQQFMIENRLDKDLRRRVLHFIDLQWRTYHGMVMPGKQFLLHDLPEALQEDLALDGIAKLLGNISLFRNTDIDFRQALARRCPRYLFPANEYVLRTGDMSRDMYVIVRGYCEAYLGKKQTSLGLMGPGECFGEAGMLYGLPKPANVITRTTCDLLIIPHGELHRVMKHFPTVNKEISEIQEDADVQHAVKMNHARVWRLARSLPREEGSLLTVDETPSFTTFSKEERKTAEYQKPFHRLGHLSFLGRLLMPRTIRPDGRFAARLEQVRVAAIVLLLVLTPVHVTFLPHNISVYAICLLLDVAAVLIMYLRLHFAYYDASSTLVSHPISTAENYLASAFLLDLARVRNLHTIVLFRMNRFAQVYEVLWAFSYWEQGVLFRAELFKVIKHLWFLGMYVHILACFWAYLACPTSAPYAITSPAPAGRALNIQVRNHSQFLKAHHNCRAISWYTMSNFTQSDNAQDLYILSVLFTLEMLAAVGSGDLTPQTRSEYILSIVLMIHGVVFFGYIIASMTASLVNADTTRARFNERMRTLCQRMKYEDVPMAVQQKVLRHIEYKFSRSTRMHAHIHFTNLPPSIRGDVAFVLFADLISSVPIFKTIDRSFHRMLAMCLKEVFFLGGETVIFEGDVGEEMYFIHRGFCDITDDDGNATKTLGPGGSRIIHEKGRTTKKQSKELTAKSLTRVPSIQVSESQNVVADGEDDVTALQAQASSLSQSPFIGSTASHEITEVYVSNQTIQAESYMSFDPEGIDKSSETKLGDKDSRYSPLSNLSGMSYRSERSAFQPPAAFKWCHSLGKRVRAHLQANVVINPDSRLLFAFNLLLTVSGAASIALFFYHVTFQSVNHRVDIAFGLCTCVYISNICIRLHTAYYDNYGDLVRDHKIIRRVYMHRPTGFLVDALSALPVGLLIFIRPEHKALRHTVTLVRMVHLTRVYSAFSFFRTLERRLIAPILLLRGIRDLGLLFMLLHICACFWYMVACPGVRCRDDSWVAFQNLLNTTHGEIYANAFYFVVATATSTGYGDINARNIDEAVLNIPIILIGKLSLGLVLGDLASTLSNLEVTRVETETRLGVIVSQMKEQNVPHRLQERVIQYVGYEWIRTRGQRLQELLKDLPYCLQLEVFMTTFGAQLRSLTIFQRAPQRLIRRLSYLCHQQFFLPGDFITKRGDIGDKVFVVRRGSVLVYDTSPSDPEYFLYSGSIYGDLQIIFPTMPYAHNLVADDPTDVLVINQTDVRRLLADYPHFYFK